MHTHAQTTYTHAHKCIRTHGMHTHDSTFLLIHWLRTYRRCQLQSVAVTPRRCQLQSVCATTPTLKYTVQELAVMGLLFGPLWDKAKQCEATSRAKSLKTFTMRTLMHSIWQKTCDLDLQDGRFTLKKNRKIVFDGSALIDVVSRYRSDTKARARFRGRIQHSVKMHYDSLPPEYQPRDKGLPLYKHWAAIRNAIRPPPVPRVQLMREAKAKASLIISKNIDSENK